MKEPYYKPLFYDKVYSGKKRGRKSKEEKLIWIEEQKLKVKKGKFIIIFS